MKKFWIGLFFLLGFRLFFPNAVFAKIGVGVGTGKIQIDEQLNPGAIYELPILTVLNTGDEESNYKVLVTYHSDQPELCPSESWFIFSPRKFYLRPGEVQVVKIKLNLPLRIKPGDYFAYLEAQPLKTSQSAKGMSIGVAAAAKLYFTVIPANAFQAMHYKLVSFWEVYSPWPQRVLFLLAGILIIGLLKKFLNIKVDLKKPVDKKPEVSEKDE